MEEAEWGMESNDEVKLASQVWNDVFSVTVVPSVDGDAAKGASDSDVTHNFRYQNLAAVPGLAMWIN
jgi:hypothetical protein